MSYKSTTGNYINYGTTTISGSGTFGQILICNGNTLQWISVPAEESFIEEPGQQKQPLVTCGNLEGYECKFCKEFSPMTELNLPLNGEIKYEFACYACRTGLYQ